MPTAERRAKEAAKKAATNGGIKPTKAPPPPPVDKLQRLDHIAQTMQPCGCAFDAVSNTIAFCRIHNMAPVLFMTFIKRLTQLRKSQQTLETLNELITSAHEIFRAAYGIRSTTGE